MTGLYCKRHDEYAPTGECRWCETPATATAHPVTPKALMKCSYAAHCPEPAAWLWSPVTGAALTHHATTKHFFCQSHHVQRAGPYFANRGWQWAAIEDAPKAPKENP